jgi:hypothetical protein
MIDSLIYCVANELFIYIVVDLPQASTINMESLEAQVLQLHINERQQRIDVATVLSTSPVVATTRFRRRRCFERFCSADTIDCKSC